MARTAFLVLLAACGDNSKASLDDFLPPVPQPDGSDPAARAGVITAGDQEDLIPGPGSHGLPGDFYIANQRVRFVIQAPGRAFGELPWGGNPIDASRAREDGSWTPDHMGEIGLIYRAGRTCGHETVDVLRDGSGGGAAVIRARGRSQVYDTINFKGVGRLPVQADLDPDVDDGIECATTYILRPGSDTLEVGWTLFNPGDVEVHGPFGSSGELGGEVDWWAPGLGFFRERIDPLQGDDTRSSYMVMQGPEVAYGMLPRYDDPATPTSIVSIAGHSVLYGVSEVLGLLGEENWHLRVPPHVGVTHWLDLVIGVDAGDVEARWRTLRGEAVVDVRGKVTFEPSGRAGAGARVGFFRDAHDDGVLDVDDPVVTYTEVDDDGVFSAAVVPGDYLVAAHAAELARTPAIALAVSAGTSSVDGGAFALKDPAVYDHTTVDDETGMPIPVKLTVVGPRPPRDFRLFPSDDNRNGLVLTQHAIRGTTEPPGDDPADAPLVLPSGGPYRVFATRGPEWSIDSALVSPSPGETGALSFRLRRVVDTTGYVATEHHEHSIGSPDSSVSFEERLGSLVTQGIELFASTDHDQIVDYDPLIDSLDLRAWIDSVPGVESTSAVWGHFNAYPLEFDPNAPAGGAPDWAEGTVPGLDLLPRELFDRLHERGASVVQVNHPRALGVETHQAFFDRVGLVFDFARHTFYGDPLAQPVPSSYMRLPEDQDLYADNFEALEVWNSFGPGDSNGDGEIELRNLDRVMRDWMAFLSLGRVLTPMGNSDSHAKSRSPAGLPRTMVRVDDDSSSALADGRVEGSVYATLRGEDAPRDVVVTDGPMVWVEAGGEPAIGRVVDAEGGAASLAVSVQSAEWADFDTVEVFANVALDPPEDDRTVLVPLVCYTMREPAAMHPDDPCLLAALAPRPLTVSLVDVTGTGVFFRRQAAVTIDLAAGDIPARSGARGDDAWVVVRVRGRRALYPLVMQNVVSGDNLGALVAAETDAELAPLLLDRGVMAAAFTAPIFIDFDGGGYRAPFEP